MPEVVGIRLGHKGVVGRNATPVALLLVTMPMLFPFSRENILAAPLMRYVDSAVQTHWRPGHVDMVRESALHRRGSRSGSEPSIFLLERPAGADPESSGWKSEDQPLHHGRDL